MGVTADTPVNIVVGAGDVSIDGQDVGATMADNVFRVVRTYFVPELNGTPGPLEGTDYLVSETAELEVTIAEMSTANLASILPNTDDTPSGADDRIWSTGTRRIASDQYKTVALTVPGLDNMSYVYTVKRAIANSNAEFTAGNAAVLSPRITFQGRWVAGSTGTLPASPWLIERLQAGS